MEKINLLPNSLRLLYFKKNPWITEYSMIKNGQTLCKGNGLVVLTYQKRNKKLFKTLIENWEKRGTDKSQEKNDQ